MLLWRVDVMPGLPNCSQCNRGVLHIAAYALPCISSTQMYRGTGLLAIAEYHPLIKEASRGSKALFEELQSCSARSCYAGLKGLSLGARRLEGCRWHVWQVCNIGNMLVWHGRALNLSTRHLPEAALLPRGCTRASHVPL